MPSPLVLAAAFVALEAIALIVLGAFELGAMRTDRLVMGASTAAFFVASGAGLGWCAWALWRGRRGGRGPALMAQLIALLLAWSLRGEDTRIVSVVLAIAGIAALVGLLHPRTIDALEGRERV